VGLTRSGMVTGDPSALEKRRTFGMTAWGGVVGISARAKAFHRRVRGGFAEVAEKSGLE